MNDKLSHLQCHFVWKPLDGIAEPRFKPNINLDPQSRIDFLKTDIKMNPEIEVPALALIAYLYTLLETPCLTDAKDFADQALKSSRALRPSSPHQARGYEIVSLSLKAHILYLEGNGEKEIDNIFSELEQLNPISNEAQAFIYGMHAYACSTLGPAKYKQGLQLSIQAAKLDPSWHAWPMSIATLGGRIRRFVEGSKSYPTAMEEENMHKAVALCQEMKPLPVVFLAEMYFTKGRFNGSSVSPCVPLLREAERLYRKAYELGPNTIYVLTRCGKAFAKMGYEEDAKKCYEKSLQLQPNDCVSLRGLGQLHEFSEARRNLEQALECYTKANTNWQKNNVHSDLDLCRIRRKLYRNFNDLEEYEKLEKKYADDNRALIIVKNAVKQKEDYLNKRAQQYSGNNYQRDNNRNQYAGNFRRGEVRTGHNGYDNRSRNRERQNYDNHVRKGSEGYDQQRNYERRNPHRQIDNGHHNEDGRYEQRYSGERPNTHDQTHSNQGRRYEQRYDGERLTADEKRDGSQVRHYKEETNNNQRFRGPPRAQSSGPPDHKQNFQQRPYNKFGRTRDKTPGPHSVRSPALTRKYASNSDIHQKLNDKASIKSPALSLKSTSRNNLDEKSNEGKKC